MTDTSSTTKPFDLLLRGATAVLPGRTVLADVGVSDGRIAAIGTLRDSPASAQVDCTGLHLLPGVIDTQVHFREPGAEHKEDLETGTAGAAAGGVTAVFEMPNTHPLTIDASTIEDKLSRAAGRAWTDHAFFVGGTGENAQVLRELELHRGCSGVKVFMGSSTGNLLVPDDAHLEAILASGRRRVAIHAEDEYRLRERFSMVEGGAPVAMHPQWRDVETAVNATRRVLRLSEKTGRPVHVLHITTADEMALLAEHKRLATVEVTPQHLTLAAPECYERLGTRAQMNPPIREAHHRDGLWRALEAGVVDVIGSDHAPHTLEEKAQPYPQSPSGMTGVQTLVPIMLDHVNAGRLTLERFVDLVCSGPQRIYNIAAKGRIAVGYDADFTIVDLAARRRIEDSWIRSRTGWTPFDGRDVVGWPKLTIVRGHIVMREDELLGSPVGEAVRFVYV